MADSREALLTTVSPKTRYSHLTFGLEIEGTVGGYFTKVTGIGSGVRSSSTR